MHQKNPKIDGIKIVIPNGISIGVPQILGNNSKINLNDKLNILNLVD